MLMHHADAGGDRGARLARRQGLAEDLDRSLIGRIMAEQDVHQRRLAGAVLAEQRDDLAALQVDRDRVIGEKRPEPLGDALRGGERFRTRIGRHQGSSMAGLDPAIQHSSTLDEKRRTCRNVEFLHRLCAMLRAVPGVKGRSRNSNSESMKRDGAGSGSDPSSRVSAFRAISSWMISATSLGVSLSASSVGKCIGATAASG